MRVLFIAMADHANVGYLFAKSLVSIGVPAICVKTMRNPRKGGTDQGIVVTKTAPQLGELINKATVIVWMHSYRVVIPKIKGKKLQAVFHGGNKYRRAYKEKNYEFNQFVGVSLIQTDLGRGAKNEHWMLPCVDTEFIYPTSYKNKEPLTIGHFPSNAGKKRSGRINRVMLRLEEDTSTKDRFVYIKGDICKWRKNLGRMDMCDVYIDSLALGAWGFAALEAAAMGKVVVGGFKDYTRYQKEYGLSPLINVREEDEQHLFKILKDLILHPEGIPELKKSHRKWVEDYHSFKYTGERLKRIFNASL